jgi:hypothetical protein
MKQKVSSFATTIYNPTIYKHQKNQIKVLKTPKNQTNIIVEIETFK